MKVLYVTSPENGDDLTPVLRELSWLEPDLDVETVEGAAAALVAVRTRNGFGALFISPLVAHNEALALIATLRRDEAQLAIVVIITESQRHFFAPAMTAGADDVLVARETEFVSPEFTFNRVRHSRYIELSEGQRPLSVVYVGEDDGPWDVLTETPFVSATRATASAEGAPELDVTGPDGSPRCPDALVIDEQAGDAHALQVVKWAHSAAPNLPVIVLSSPAGADIGGAAIELGADDVVIKTGSYRRRLLAALHRVYHRGIRAGSAGSTGSTGSAGSAGAAGATGSTGSAGFTGSAGAAGPEDGGTPARFMGFAEPGAFGEPAEVAILRASLENAEHQLREANSALASTESSLADLERDVDHLRRERDGLLRRTEDLQQQGEARQRDGDEARRQIEELRGQLEAAGGDHDTFQRERESFQQELDILQRQRDGARQETDALRRQLDAAARERDALQRQQGELQQKNEELREASGFGDAMRGRDREELATLQRALAEERERRVVLEHTLRHTEDRARADVAAAEAQQELARRELEARLAGAADRLNVVATDTQSLQSRLEQALAAGSAERARAVEGMRLGQALVTLGGELVRCNDVFAAMFGFASPADALNHAPGTVFTGLIDHPQIVAGLERGDNLSSVESAARQADGRPFRILTAATRIERAGEPPLIERLCFDLSDRRQLESQLRLSRRLEAAGRLAAEMAPEVDPLLDRLDAGVFAPESDERRLATLVRQLLAFSRRQAKPAGYLSLNDIVRRQDALLRQVAGDMVSVTFQLNDVDAIAAGEDDVAALIGAVVSACAACLPYGGTVAVTTAPHADGFLLGTGLDVTATGYGVLRISLSPSLERLASRCGGSLRATSEPGRSTTLHVQFPC